MIGWICILQSAGPDNGAAISLYRGVVLGLREDLNNIMAIAILFLLYLAENFH